MASVARVEPADPGDHRAISAYVARAQLMAARHVTYVGDEAATILAEFAEVGRWDERLTVAKVDEAIVGVLLAEIDEEMRRVWWVGPWADSPVIAFDLLDDACGRFGSLFDTEEMAPDSRNDMLRSIAADRGFIEGTSSSVLTITELDSSGEPSTVPLTEATSAAVARLHDLIFPGTHTPGAKLVTAERTRIRVVSIGDRPVGYVAYEIQPDGAGYIDFLGVVPELRRGGLGRTLVIDACRDLAIAGAGSAHLTVRAGAQGAVDLYRSIGFIEERAIIPCRKGFTLE
jgi:ribosomal protein S18 acetylase RimI-like enzyme